MNRKERREQERMLARENKQAERYAQMVIAREKVRQKECERIEKNGITIKDLEANYQKGYSAGFNAAAEPTYRTMLAAFCLALHEVYGFGEKRILKALQAADEKFVYSLTDMELVQEVFDKTGLEILFGETFDRVRAKV